MRIRRGIPRIASASVAAVSALLVMVLAPRAEAGSGALVFHGASSGKTTLDEGEGGGNPFASALIELLGRPPLRLGALPTALRAATALKSRGHQAADVPTIDGHDADLSLVPAAPGERRLALVLVVADYELSALVSLPGARRDAERVARALRTAGFSTEVAVDRGLARMRETLAGFRARSREHDIAVVYATGHGVEVDGRVRLLPGDYPSERGNTALVDRALPLSEIAAAAAARRINLIFYAGCRDNPFAE
ncbi:MAG: caspase family protein [Hyphomicrobiaceae bacterium]